VNAKPDPSSSEPALVVGAVTAAVTAVLALLASFGLGLTAEQAAAVTGVAAVLAPLVSGWVTRSRVYSPASVAKLTDPPAREAR
jgi:hypothetical protein